MNSVALATDQPIEYGLIHEEFVTYFEEKVLLAYIEMSEIKDFFSIPDSFTNTQEFFDSFYDIYAVAEHSNLFHMFNKKKDDEVTDEEVEENEEHIVTYLTTFEKKIFDDVRLFLDSINLFYIVEEDFSVRYEGEHIYCGPNNEPLQDIW